MSRHVIVCLSLRLMLTISITEAVHNGGHHKAGRSDDSVEICSSDYGSLFIAPRANHIATVNEGKVKTVFVNFDKKFDFECKLKNETNKYIPQIEFRASAENATRLNHSYANTSRAQRSLNSSWLTALNPINFENVTVECTRELQGSEEQESSEEENDGDNDNRNVICRVKVIVIRLFNPSCSVNGSLSCKTAALWSELNVGRNNAYASIKDDDKELSPVVRYSIFAYENQSWVYCNETDTAGLRSTGGNRLEVDTESIVCPVPRKSFKGPVLIRVEESEKTGLSVALPFYGGGGNTSYTYFSVFVNQTVYDDNEPSDVRTPNNININEAVFIAPVAVSCVFLVCLFVGLIFCFRRRWRRQPKDSNKKSKFYVDNVLEHKGYDNMSTHTQSTFTNGYAKPVETTEIPMLDFENNGFFFFDESDEYNAYLPMVDGDDEESVNLRRNIVARQLSGDPSKINPTLSLNQQANALAYNPKLEIDRSKFTIGELLGSGNFGSVYVGEAQSLYYPGSVTKVAIKTVNDALDRSQLTALLCEVKILANLDHHLNLVNLMGSCTSELHNGELWLLLEYCGHGDLKNFLIRHRTQFKNNLSGLCATGFDSRLFLKWAHSIAKGMEYLTSKRIMHGDLAARNILISATEGYIAKVSDFGLSKTFYDNVRYKKRFRHYVPWKWMAIEYLKDACFTMKSDVWSYGVVLWEIFSLGQEPYAGKSIEEVITQIKLGYRLPCPEDVESVSWADDVYADVMRKCWDADPSTRCSFSEIVNALEKLLDVEELNEYQDCTEKCRNMKELMLDDSRSKRVSMLSPHSAPGDYSNISKTEANDGQANVGQATGSAITVSSTYVTVEEANSGCEPRPLNAANGGSVGGGYISVMQAKQQLSPPPNGAYITVSQAKSQAIINAN